MNGWGATKHGISRSGYLNVTSHCQAGRGLTSTWFAIMMHHKIKLRASASHSTFGFVLFQKRFLN